MAKLSSKTWLFRYWLQRYRQECAGFTLIELLISLIMVGIIMSGLLYLVVEMMKIQRREAVLDQTQRDIQRALDFMVEDMREAVHVYSSPTTVVSQLDDWRTGTVGDEIPVLAFWRPDPIELPATPCSGANSTECEVLKVRRSAYTLVVYYLQPNDGNTTWPGKARIIRYELPKYKNVTTLQSTPGYVDPTSRKADGTLVGFETWTAATANTEGTKSVLVDYVDSPTATVNSAALPSCTSYGATTTSYLRIPTAASTSNSFFACVRNSSPEEGQEGVASNQDAFIFLRGNATSSETEFVSALSKASELPTLQAGVLIRGVLEKVPQS